MTEVSCRRARRLAVSLELGELGEADRMILELHLQQCRSCASVETRVRGLARLLQDAPLEASSRTDRSIIASAMMAAAQPIAAPSRARLQRRWIVALAASLALVVGAGLVARTFFAGADPAQKMARGSRPDESSAAPVVAVFEAPCPGVQMRGMDEARARIVTSNPTRCEVLLDLGSLAIYVDPEQTTSLTVETPHTMVRVVGTVLSVDVDEQRTRVTVERGLVEVGPVDSGGSAGAASEGAVSVAAGRTAQRASSAEVEVRASTADELTPLGALARELELPVRRRTADAAPVEVSPQPEEPSVARRSGAHRIARLRRLLRSEPPAAVRRRIDVELRDPRVARRRAELLTIVAESYLMEGDHARALEAYGRVWRGRRSSTAGNALIAGADVALRRLRDPGRARGLYERYLAEYPRGPLREVALVGRCRALAAAGAPSVSACVSAYERDYPEGRFSGPLRRLRSGRGGGIR